MKKILLLLNVIIALDSASQQSVPFFNNGKYGIKDSEGNVIMQPLFDAMSSFDERGIAVVMCENKYAYINNNGATLTSFIYEDAGAFSDGLARVMLGGVYGYINENFEVQIPCQFIFAENFDQGVARVCRGEEWFLINVEGHNFSNQRFQDLERFSEGIAAAKSNGLWGYIDKNANWVIEPQFDNAGYFQSSNTGAVMSQGDYIWINRSGKMIGYVKSIRQIERQR